MSNFTTNFAHTFDNSFTHFFAHTLSRTFTHTFDNSFTHSFAHTFAHTFDNAFIRTFTHLYLSPIPPAKKFFFAADFHLGTPDFTSTEDREHKNREHKILTWLDTIRPEAHALFLLGDIFDFWFKYEDTLPKDFVKLQDKLAAFTALHIPVYLIVGNHDRWIKDSFLKQLNIPILDQMVQLHIGDKKLLIGHGDGLSGSSIYCLFKKYMNNSSILNWIGRNLPAPIKSPLTAYISKMRRKKDRSSNVGDIVLPVKDHIFQFCKELVEPADHHDYYVFGHLHFPYSRPLNDASVYFNIGDWITHFSYGMFDGVNFQLAKVK